MRSQRRGPHARAARDDPRRPERPRRRLPGPRSRLDGASTRRAYPPRDRTASTRKRSFPEPTDWTPTRTEPPARRLMQTRFLSLALIAAAATAGTASAAEILVTTDIAVSTTWTANNTYNLQTQ